MIRRLARCNAGSTAVEFALIGTLLMSLCFGIVELALIMWAKDSLQLTASLAARCGAAGTYGANSCGSTAATQSYAVSLVGSWLIAGAIAPGDVTAVSGASTCRSATGKFYVVTINCTYFASGWLPPPFGNQTVNVTACYPMA